jgi:hypothetical protein
LQVGQYKGRLGCRTQIGNMSLTVAGNQQRRVFVAGQGGVALCMIARLPSECSNSDVI